MRRTVLLITAAVLLALPASAAGAPRASDFELAVDSAGTTARAASGTWTSKVMRPGRTFDVFGLRWKRAPEHAHVEVRVADRHGWKRWTEVGHAHSAKGSDPVWAGGAHAVQVRTEGRIRGMRLHFVDVRGKAGKRGPTARASAAQPAIVPRAQWGGDTQCRPRDTPTFGSVQMAFVHHTVSANEYGPADAAAMVLGICRFHRNSNGWDDIGYNFLVDKYGQIFEGRAGGIDQPIVGAQVQGWNAQSTGIANLGTYQNVPQTSQAIDAMARLIAWKLPLHGTPVTGGVALRSGGGSGNRYPAGTTHTFERISGHRDGNSTECPGAQLYAQLPQLRQLAASRAPALIGGPQPGTAGSTLTLGAARTAFAYPEPAQLSGRLVAADGQPIGHTLVRIQVLTAKGFKAVSSTTTAPDGTYTAALPTTRNRSVRALVGSVTSNTVRLRVAPALEIRTPDRRVHFKRRLVIRGKLRPKKGKVVVEAALQRSERSYRRVLRMTTKARRGSFRAAVPLKRPGLYRVRVRFDGDKRNAPIRADYYVRSVRQADKVGDATAVGAVRVGR